MEESLTTILSKPEIARLLMLFMLGSAVFMGCAGILLGLFPAADPLKARRSELGLISKVEVEDNKLSILPDKTTTRWDRISAVFLPKGEKARELNMDRLTRAGYRTVTALATYHAVRGLLMILLPLVVVTAASFIPGWPLTRLYPYLVGAFVAGMIIPSYILDRKVDQRMRKLRNAMPDALDLLVVCTESGLGINAALVRVYDELRFIHPEFAAELAILNGEIRAGLDREQAFANMINRSGLDDMKTMVALLLQSLRFGTSVAETLRVYSEEFRDKRMQAAQEEAAKLATKMIFPLILCFMPAFFVVAMGPAMLSIIKVFS